MKPLVKVMLILGSIFALTFVAGRLFGILTVENVEIWLEQAASVDPWWLAGLVILLLFIDIFVAVPTLTITILAGYFLGFSAGAISAFAGISAAAFTGYGMSRIWGEKPISLLVRNPDEREEMRKTFQRNGPMMIMLSRAAPIVPEVTACMAGATKMSFLLYLVYFSLSTAPYVMIASYAGSVSSIDNPRPALFAVLFLYATLWIGWYFFGLKNKSSARGATD